MKKTIKEHEKEYIHIPFNKKKFGYFCLFILGLVLNYLHFLYLISVGKIFKVWTLLDSINPKLEYQHISQLLICYPLISQAILIVLTISCLCYSFGKRIDYEGLMVGLIYGLIGGLIFGLIVGLMVGLIYGLIGGLIFGLIGGLIGGLIFGLK